YLLFSCLIFFLQAEDGIRDSSVTGVQTCALPISAMIAERCNVLMLEPAADDIVKLSWLSDNEGFAAYFPLPDGLAALAGLLRSEIGRASCRERGWMRGVGGELTNKREDERHRRRW